MKRLGYILINILFIGLCGCEQNERIEYMLYIENHSADTIRLKTESGTLVDECTLGSHEMMLKSVRLLILILSLF